jgi:hypothetical protein
MKVPPESCPVRWEKFGPGRASSSHIAEYPFPSFMPVAIKNCFWDQFIFSFWNWLCEGHQQSAYQLSVLTKAISEHFLISPTSKSWIFEFESGAAHPGINQSLFHVLLPFKSLKLRIFQIQGERTQKLVLWSPSTWGSQFWILTKAISEHFLILSTSKSRISEFGGGTLTSGINQSLFHALLPFTYFQFSIFTDQRLSESGFVKSINMMPLNFQSP